MQPLTLEGETLGKKQEHFNELVRDAVANKLFTLSKINYDDSDINNLFKIHTACKTRNVDFIIEVLKCEDMLYVSTAIRHSTWLINEKEYTNIINPEYLYKELLPYMPTRAINKLLLYIRLHLKDEKRLETFYERFKDLSKQAPRWLSNCSIPYIKKVLQHQQHVTPQLFQRLCQRSIDFLPYYTKVQKHKDRCPLQSVIFLLKLDTETYLNVLETNKSCCFPFFNKLHTKMLMKRSPKRILNNFEKYKNFLKLSSVAKYMKREDITDFLLNHRQNNDISLFLNNQENLKHFIYYIPETDRFEFVKKTYINKTDERTGSNELPYPPPYTLYQYATFDEALDELKNLIRAENSPAERYAMFSVLITCSRKDMHHTNILLNYYFDEHRSEPFKYQLKFVIDIITEIPTYKLDSETWNILDKLFQNLGVYTGSANDMQQKCLQSIILYKVINDEKVPDIIETKIEYEYFQILHENKLNEEDKNKIYSYLLNCITTIIQNKTVDNESDLSNVIYLLTNALDILSKWRKDINKYMIRKKIQEIAKNYKFKSWEHDFWGLYDISKPWRCNMFKEGIMLWPNEDVCIMALKNDPSLLEQYNNEVNALRTKTSISLHRFLTKLRVYWPQTFAQQWIEFYLASVIKTRGQKVLIRGLFAVLPKKQLRDFALKYAPKDVKNDSDIKDQAKIDLQKNIAKNLHLARPLPALDVILWYAKDDYSQYALPSLNAILHNMSKVQRSGLMLKLLQSPVSLQKYSFNIAFKILNYEERTQLFSNINEITKDISLRSALFKHVYNLLCKIKDSSKAKELWKVLNVCIDNLTACDCKEILDMLLNTDMIHEDVRGEFYMKSYLFYSTLPKETNYGIQDRLNNQAPKMMYLLDANFVVDKILAPLENQISNSLNRFLEIRISYILHGKSEEEQCERFRKVLMPSLEYALKTWDLEKKKFDTFCETLVLNFIKYFTVKKIIVPVKLFSEIQTFMERHISIEENYVRYTRWKLLTEYVQLVVENEVLECTSTLLSNIKLSDFKNGQMPYIVKLEWNSIHIKISPRLGKIIVKHLKADTERYFPTICWLFSHALKTMFLYLSFEDILMEMETLKYMIFDVNFVPSYLVFCHEIPRWCNREQKAKVLEIVKVLSTHPSEEVQMHYRRAIDILSSNTDGTEKKCLCGHTTDYA